MGSYQKFVAVGNLGRNAELRTLPGGQVVAALSLAVSETWKDKSGDKQERTTWFRVNVWGKQAETLAEYLTTGKQILVEGKLEHREWEKDGIKRTSTEIRADRVVLLSGVSGLRRDADQGEVHEPELVTAGGHNQVVNDDDIPFAWLMPFIVPALGILGVLSA